MGKTVDNQLKEVIEEAVNAGLQAGRVQASTRAKDAFQATERRLYAIPVLTRKVKKDIEKLEETRSHGLRERSRSLVRFQKTGYRVDPEEMLEAIIRDLEATIAADEHEIETVSQAMETFKDDTFYPTVTGRYIDRYEDDDIAADLDCSTTQVWRQRTRIVKDIAVMLYGADAI